MTVDSLYVKELVEEKFVAREKKSARHVASSHVESEGKK